MGKKKDDPVAAVAESSNEKDDLPESSKLDLDAEQSKQTMQILSGLLGSKDIDTMRMSVPAFIHYGDSALERQYYMWHPDLFLKIADEPTPLQRMKAVVTFLISTYHGILLGKNKKPFNPVMGEMYIARSPPVDGQEVYYFSEQISHHPPGMAIHYVAPAKNISLTGTFFPKGSFTGTAMKMWSDNSLTLSVGAHGEEYKYSLPALYLRGILYGKSFLDINGEVKVTCEQTKLSAVIHFKPKPWFFGEYRKVDGSITNADGSVAYTLQGKWSEVVTLTDAKTKATETIINTAASPPAEPIVKPLEEQGAMESQKLWQATAEAIRAKHWKEADKAKNQLEERQRVYLREVEKETIKHHFTLFEPVGDGSFRFKPRTTDPEALKTGEAYQYTAEQLAGWLGKALHAQ